VAGVDARLKVTIIHGTGANPQKHWFPWLSSELTARGHEVYCPHFPPDEKQNPKDWLATFDREVGTLQSNMVLVGHSIGCALIVRLLERTKAPIVASFFVAGFIGTIGDEQFDWRIRPFFEDPIDWDKVRRNAGKIFVYGSDNDSIVPPNKFPELADHLGVELTLIERGGHMNADSGYLKFDRLLEDFDSIIEME
jgi:predicted alpha/beta hydrolase family esterase